MLPSTRGSRFTAFLHDYIYAGYHLGKLELLSVPVLKYFVRNEVFRHYLWIESSYTQLCAKRQLLPKLQHQAETITCSMYGTEKSPVHTARSANMTAAPTKTRSCNFSPQRDECLFELTSLGPVDLLYQCREGSGNWWGDEDCVRVDEQGRVVLVDSNAYYKVSIMPNRIRKYDCKTVPFLLIRTSIFPQIVYPGDFLHHG